MTKAVEFFQMNPETLTALKASIKHWEFNASHSTRRASYGQSACALCRLFNPLTRGSNNYTDSDVDAKAARLKGGCRGCPVQEKTGQHFCDGSPFELAEKAAECRDEEGWTEHAQAELDFLKSLLPTT